MRGTEHTMLFVDVDDRGTDVALYILRDTPLGISELEHKLTLSLLPDGGEDAKTRLKSALIAVVEHL